MLMDTVAASPIGPRCWFGALKVAGVVCMDLTMIDVSDIPGVQVGDEVILLGKQGSEEIQVFELARWAETIPYEIFCGIGKPVPRFYEKEG